MSPERCGTVSSSTRVAGPQGVAVFAAAGNDGSDNDAEPTYPASYELPNVVAVAGAGVCGRDAAMGYSES